MSANIPNDPVAIQRFFTSRDNYANASTYVGQEQRLWYDPVTNAIYVSDGNTPGGVLVSGGGGTISVSNQGNVIANTANSINFVGTGVVANATGNAVTVTVNYIGNANVAVIPAVYFTAAANGNNQTFSDTALTSYASNTDITLFYNGSLLENTFYTLSGDTLTVNTPLVTGDTIDITQQFANAVSLLPATYGNANVVAYLNAGIAGNIIPSANNAFSLGNATNQWASVYVGANTLYVNLVPLTISGTTLQVDGANVVTTTGGTDDISVTGNVTADYFIGDGSQLTNLPVQPGTYGNANVEAYLPTSNTIISINSSVSNTNSNVANLSSSLGNTNSNVANNTSNITTLQGQVYANANAQSYLASNSNVTITTTGNITTTANISGNYVLGNGSQLTGLPAGYSNADVATYLASNSNVTITTTGNATAGNIATAGLLSATGNVTGGNIVTAGFVSATGNITGNYFVGNGSQLTGLPAGYSNADVATYLASNANVTITTTGNITTTANVVAAYLWGDGSNLTNVSSGSYGNANVANYLASNANVTITTTGNITTTANISGAYVLGNGSQLTGLPAGYSNADVATYLASNANVTITTTGNITTTANISGAYVLGNGSQLTGLPAGYSNADVATYLASNSNVTITTTGNITGDHFFGNGSALTGVTASGVNAAALTGTTLSSSVVLSNLTSVGTLSNLSVAGNITGGNLRTAGLITATGNITGGNVQTAGVVSATGNVTGGNVVTAGLISATGNVNAGAMYINGNAVITGNANIQGNLTYNNLTNLTTSNLVLGLGNNQTGINVTGGGIAVGNTNEATLLYNFASNSWVSNINLSVSGNVAASGRISATGNVTGGNVTTAGAVNAANITATGDILANNIGAFGWANALNASIGQTLFVTGQIIGDDEIQAASLAVTQGISATESISGGNILTLGQISSQGNVTTDSFFIGNGSLLTGITASYGNANVSEYLANSNVIISTTGNVTSGNILTNGQVSATGNATAGNVVTAGVISATGTATAGNIATAGTVSGTGNVTGGNIRTAGLITATGNITGGNVVTAGLVSATANVTAGNVLTGGLISATGTITSAGNIAGANVTTAGLVSATGNVTGGNVVTGGIVSSTGNVTGGNVLTAGLISATGNATAGNITSAGLANITGNITGGNVLTGGLISATGNVTGGNIAVVNGNGNVILATTTLSNVLLTRGGVNAITISSNSIALGNTSGSAGFFATPVRVVANTSNATSGNVMFYNTTTQEITTTAIPAFSATGSGNTVISTAFVATQVAYATEVYDSDGWFASNRFTPLRGGWYQINGGARCLIAGGALNIEASVQLRKNGSAIAFQAGAGLSIGIVSQLVYFNGSTDYVDVAISSGTTGNVAQTATQAVFNGYWVRP